MSRVTCLVRAQALYCLLVAVSQHSRRCRRRHRPPNSRISDGLRSASPRSNRVSQSLKWLPPLPSRFPARFVAPPDSPSHTHTRLTPPRLPRRSARPTSPNNNTTTATALACLRLTPSPTRTPPRQTRKMSSPPVPCALSSDSASPSTPTASPSLLATVRARGEKKTSHMAPLQLPARALPRSVLFVSSRPCTLTRCPSIPSAHFPLLRPP